jgi:hypothetical protein
MKATQIDNFFESINVIYKECRKLKFCTIEEFASDKDGTWPGKRTEELYKVNPLLQYFVEKYLFLNNIITAQNTKKISMYVHARFKSDENKDWIHKDKATLGCLLYLSPTNLNSGTYLFSQKNEIINDFKFVQNRLIAYDANYNHMGYGHHGDTIDNCRLTLNIFTKQ